MSDQGKKHSDGLWPSETGLPLVGTSRGESKDFEEASEEEIESRDSSEPEIELTRRNVRLNGLLVLITFISSLVAIWQGFIAQQSADTSEQSVLVAQRAQRESRLAAGKSSKESAKALQATIENFHSEQRAWVVFDSMLTADGTPNTLVQVGQPLQAGVRVINSGRTPAFDVVALSDMDVYLSSVKPRLNLPIDKRADPISNSVMPPNGGKTLRPSPLGTVQPEDLQKIRDGEATVYVWGKVTYKDAFGKRHTTTFCNYLRGDLLGYASCDRFNTAD